MTLAALARFRYSRTIVIAMRARVFGQVLIAAAVTAAAGCGASAKGPIVVRPPVLAPAPPPAPKAAPKLDVTKILAFGDNLTEGTATPQDPPTPFVRFEASTPGPAASYPFKLQGLLAARYPAQTIHVFNGGRGGETASAAKTRFVELLDTLQPEVVILMDGVNDLNQSAEVPATAAAVLSLAAEARAHGAKVLLATIPRQRAGGQRASAPDQIVPFDRELARTAGAQQIDLVDIYPEITDTFVAPDGLHLTEAGNQRLAEMFFDALRSKFEGASVFFENSANHVHRLPL